jgi:hypothetical protein
MSGALKIPVTAFTAKITLRGRFQPRNAIVGIIPGEPIILEMI